MATSLAGAAILALMLLAPTAGAQATPSTVGAKPAPAAAEEPIIEPRFEPRIEPGKHCVTSLDYGQSVCVENEDDLATAVKEETGLTLVESTASRKTSTSSTSTTARAASAAPAVLISRIFDDVNYGGGSFAMAYSGANCSSYTYGMPNLGEYGWNGRVSAFKSYNGCKTALFSGTGYTGSTYGYQTNASSLGSFNDDARSWRVS
ncbi:hypothetical protein [Microbacterium dauci]|uniref:Peptidase inhibitor family I36 n=1 Tax=Microbacterium dauci TaxID=3048008 RepID=A0ABT6ZDY7_9MICO|nr:hypothetical protein [Microbacterium sp. LX3-4]MDJ1114196.1 hypothetical protein [Microbacterium sp. LX3-4]